MTVRLLARGAAAALIGMLMLGGFDGGRLGMVEASAQMMQQVDLDAATVEAFIQSYPAVKDAAKTIGAKYGLSTEGDAQTAWGAWMAATGAWGDLNAIVTPYGFTDFSNWLQVTMTVATTYAFAASGGAIDQGVAQALAAIKDNPSLSDAQKQMMIQQLQGSMGAMAAMQPSETNLAAVKPYMAELKALFD